MRFNATATTSGSSSSTTTKARGKQANQLERLASSAEFASTSLGYSDFWLLDLMASLMGREKIECVHFHLGKHDPASHLIG